MPALDDVLREKLLLLEARHARRELKETARLEGVKAIRGGKEYISFSCNDYLGLSHHREVVAAAIRATEKYGAGAGASRLVTGNHALYDELEQAIAFYKGTESAVIFGSGYLANIGSIPALAGKNDLILADKLIHACMVDAGKLSGATAMRFAHNNMEHLRLLLENNRAEHQHCLILTETVFSMDGDRAPIQALKSLAAEFDAWLMSDDAHGMGVLPASHKGADKLPDIQMGTFSKAAGSYGGYVCGSKALTDYLKTAARSLVFSTGLPPAAIAASIAALKIIARDPELVARPLKHAHAFTSLLGLPPAMSAIVPVILKENEKALAASRLLEERGFLVAAIRPPTVPEGTARLRFAFSALHEPDHIEKIASLVKQQGWVCEPQA